MNSQEHITGILLAGGKSSRMGTDKGLIEWQGRTFTEHILSALTEVCKEIMIISANPVYQHFGWPVYPDLVKDKGPLGGVYTGLHSSSTEGNLVVSCDIPLLDASFLRSLLAAAKDHEVCITANAAGQWEPLAGYYHRRCLKIFERMLQLDRLKMEEAIRQTDYHVIRMEEYPEQLRNINTKEDFKFLS